MTNHTNRSATVILQFHIAALVLGLFEIGDGVLHLSRVTNDWRISFSLLEVVWFVVSVGALFWFRREGVPSRVPHFFIAYILISVILVSVLSGGDVENYQLASEFGYVIICFGALYSWLSYATLRALTRK
jgi:hypothetical protein